MSQCRRVINLEASRAEFMEVFGDSRRRDRNSATKNPIPLGFIHDEPHDKLRPFSNKGTKHLGELLR